MKKNYLLLGLFAIFAGALSLLISCGGDDGPSDSDLGFAGISSYVGPGSTWSETLDYDNGTFTVGYDHDDNGNTTGSHDWSGTGTMQVLTTRFLKFTFSTVTPGSSAQAPSVGDAAYGLNIPGMTLLVKPISDDSEIISMAQAGTCPTTNFTANWIKFKSDNSSSDSGSDWFGVFSYAPATGSARVTYSYALNSSYTSVGGHTFTSGTCSNGLMQVVDGNTVRIYLTALGGAIVDTNKEDPDSSDRIIAMPVQTITQTDMAGDYVGLVFMDSDDDDDVRPVKGVMDSTGTSFSVVGYSNIETGDTTTDISGAVTISAVNSPQAGFMKANLSVENDATNPMSCMFAKNVGSASRAKIIFCVGQEPDGSSSPDGQYNALFVSYY